MSWTEEILHPRYEETAQAIQMYILGVFDSCFRSQYGRAMEEALTPHQREAMQKGARAAAIFAIKKSYIPVCKDYRSVCNLRSRRAAGRLRRKKKR